MANEEECNTGLSLGLGLGEYAAATAKARRGTRQRDNKSTATACLDLSFTLCPKREATARGAAVDSKLKASTTTEEEEEDDDGSKIWESNNNNSSRKKLRLTKEQSNLLEDRFKLHTTLNSVRTLIPMHRLIININIRLVNRFNQVFIYLISFIFIKYKINLID